MKLSIIIVNWNAGPLLRKCLDAIPAAGRPQVEVQVFVVDNASTDDSVNEARKSSQPFQLLSPGENLGFARANNLALERATGDVLLLLNPDTELKSGSLSPLLDFFSTHPRAGIVGGKLLNPDGSVQPSVRTFPTTAALALLLTRLARVLPRSLELQRYEMTDFRYDQETLVDQVMGACFAVRRSVIQDVGVLDPGYWIWFEEVDYCRRAAAAGWETWFVPAVGALHIQAAAFRSVSSLRRSWWFARSALRYARKHLGVLPAAALTLLVPCSLLTSLVADILGFAPGVLKSR